MAATKKKTAPKKKAVEQATGSAKYPRHSVKKVLRIPGAILDQNAGNPCSSAETAEYLGVGHSGPYQMEVSSAKKYGLLDSPAEGKIQPSELAKKILRPQSEADEIQGLREELLKFQKYISITAAKIFQTLSFSKTLWWKNMAFR